MSVTVEKLINELNKYYNSSDSMSFEELKELSRLLTEASDQVGGDIRKIYQEKAKLVEERLKSLQPFTDDELVYSAHAICKCGAGMAYPKNVGTGGAWICSDQLKNPKRWRGVDNQTYATEDGVTHTRDLPFNYYEIKSEDQPSAQGATTRPKGDQ